MPEALRDGRRLAWREAGAGPAVLMAHCSLGHSGLWKGVMAALPGYACTAVDLPAHGRSDPPGGDASLALTGMEDCGWHLDRCAGRVHLVGLSLGAAGLSRLALARPERVASLTLIEPPLFYLVAESDPEAFAISERLFAPVRAALATGDSGRAAEVFVSAWGVPDQATRFDDAARAALGRTMVPLAADLPLMEGQIAPTLTLADFARLACPVMLVEGSETKPPARAVLDALSRTLPRARRHVVAGAGHLVPVDQPAAVATLLAAFFRDHPS